MKKSLLALLLLPLIASCSLFGGGEDDPENDPNSEEGSKKLTIRFHVDSKTIEGQGYQKIIDAFNNDHAKEGIKVTASFVARTGSDDAYSTQLAKDKISGTLPDIITFDAPNCASYAKNEFLYDISDALTQEEKSKFLTLNTYEGKLYGIPIQESSAGFYYNKQIFADAHIDVSGYTVDNPWTFDQFKVVCEQLKAAGKTAVDMRMDATTDETATYLLYPFIYAAGGSFVDQSGLTSKGYFDSDSSINGYKFLRDLLSSQYTSKHIGATDFFTGKVGMYLSSGWTIPDLDNKFEAVFGIKDRTKWGILPYPKSVTAASATGSWSYAITQNKRVDKTLVIELFKYITNGVSSKTITDHTGMIAANKDADVHYEVGSPEYVLRNQLEKTGKERPVTVGYPQFSTAFRNVIGALTKDTNDSGLAELVHNQAQVLQNGLDRIN